LIFLKMENFNQKNILCLKKKADTTSCVRLLFCAPEHGTNVLDFVEKMGKEVEKQGKADKMSRKNSLQSGNKWGILSP